MRNDRWHWPLAWAKPLYGQAMGLSHCCLALLWLAAAAPAQQLVQRGTPLRLGLKQAVDLALAPEGNTRIQLAQELVRQSEARRAQARAALLPNLDAAVVEQSQTRNLAAFGIQIRLPVPGFAFPTFVGPFTVFDARTSATQSVFDFSAIRRFQAAKAGLQATDDDRDSARDQTAGQIATLYLSALAAQAHVEAAQANVELADATARLALNRKNAGTGTGIEVTRAQVQLADQRQRLLVAENERRRARLQLLRGIGLRLDTEVELTDKLEYVPMEPVTLEQAVSGAMAARPDVKAQQARESTARLSYSATKMERLPTLAAFADYGSSGSGITASVPTRSYGVQLRIPVFDGGRRDARRAESLSQARQESIRTADLRQQVELELRLALDALNSARDQLTVAQEGLKQAEQETAQARRRYEAGVASSIEPTDAQTRLERARDNNISALLAYSVARINLAQAMGNIRQVIQ